MGLGQIGFKISEDPIARPLGAKSSFPRLHVYVFEFVFSRSRLQRVRVTLSRAQVRAFRFAFTRSRSCLRCRASVYAFAFSRLLFHLRVCVIVFVDVVELVRLLQVPV